MRINLSSVLFSLLLASLSPLSAQDKTIGLLTHDQDRVSAGYILLAPKHYTRTYLIDNFGQVINTWDSGFEPGQSAHLLPNGHLLRAAMVKVPGGGTGGGEGGRIEEYDWEGNLVWAFDHATQDYALHHDIKPLPNGNVIALMVERKTQAEVVAAGFKPELLADNYLLPDAVVEIEPVRPTGGRIVWEWHVWDHLVQSADATKANYGDPSTHPELVNPNASGKRIPAFWNHMNAIDYNPDLDQIILSVRGNSELWIIDHSTTTAEAAGHTGGRYGKGGDLLYRWGNPVMYGAGPAADQMLFNQHDTQWIEPGSPGAGNLLAFNNGNDRPGSKFSSVDEIAPPLEAGGNYSIAAGSAYGPRQYAWSYAGTHGTEFYSEAISGAQRQPNGNTLICYGTHGVLAEVSPGKETVWEYVNPVVKEGPQRQGETAENDQRGHRWNAVFKVRRYPPDYAGLEGKDLTPKGLIETYEIQLVNGASFQGGPAAAGAILTAYGDNLSDGEGVAGTTPLPTTLAGATVEITDSIGTMQSCELFYVSAGQVNFAVPDSCAPGLATLTIRSGSGETAWASVAVEPVTPGLFAMGASGIGAIVGLRVNAAGERSDVPVFQYEETQGQFTSVPIDLKAETDQIYLSLYGTGIRGGISTSPITVTVDGLTVPVIGAAAHQQFTGLDQVNVGPLPAELAGRGEVGVTLRVGNRVSNTVLVHIL